MAWPPPSVSCSGSSYIAVTDPESAGESETEHDPGLISSIQGLVATLIQILETRIGIISTEFEEERERLRELVLYGFMALFFGSLGIVLATVFVVVHFWDEHRLVVVATFAVIYLIAGAACGMVLKKRMASRSRLFSTTLSELSKDRVRLDREETK